MSFSRYHRLDFVSISSSSTTCYSRLFDIEKEEYYKSKKVVQPRFEKHQQQGLSSKGKRNLCRSVETLLNLVSPNIMLTGEDKKKISFITLTLPSTQIKKYHVDDIEYYATDKEIKSKCLNQLLTELHEKYSDLLFVWVAEKQINGSIHFHLLANRYIPYKYLLDSWNRLVNKFGFVDRYAEKMKELSLEDYLKLYQGRRSLENAVKAYYKGVSENWQCPNSVSIENLKKVKNVCGYICKYMSKGDSNNPKYADYLKELSLEYKFDLDLYKEKFYNIDGRIWQCSQLISKKRKCIFSLSFDKIRESFCNLVSNISSDKIYEDDRFFCVSHTLQDLKKYSFFLYNAYLSNLNLDFSKFKTIDDYFFYIRNCANATFSYSDCGFSEKDFFDFFALKDKQILNKKICSSPTLFDVSLYKNKKKI